MDPERRTGYKFIWEVTSGSTREEMENMGKERDNPVEAVLVEVPCYG